jgi:hypothetical protein
MMMTFNCSYRNKNEPSAIYPSFGGVPLTKVWSFVIQIKSQEMGFKKEPEILVTTLYCA